MQEPRGTLYQIKTLIVELAREKPIINNKNHNITIAMSSYSCADTDSVLAGVIKMFISESLPWLGAFKCLYQSHCPGWRYLNVYISVTAPISTTQSHLQLYDQVAFMKLSPAPPDTCQIVKYNWQISIYSLYLELFSKHFNYWSPLKEI